MAHARDHSYLGVRGQPGQKSSQDPSQQRNVGTVPHTHHHSYYRKCKQVARIQVSLGKKQDYLKYLEQKGLEVWLKR
jgi:hypothetical protein